MHPLFPVLNLMTKLLPDAFSLHVYCTHLLLLPCILFTKCTACFFYTFNILWLFHFRSVSHVCVPKLLFSILILPLFYIFLYVFLFCYPLLLYSVYEMKYTLKIPLPCPINTKRIQRENADKPVCHLCTFTPPQQ